jgi:glycine hydroxymethyltransferase
VGTPAITTLGMGEAEMQEIANILVDVLSHTTPTIVEKTGQPSKASCKVDPAALQRAQGRVKDLLGNYPLYPEIDLHP